MTAAVALHLVIIGVIMVPSLVAIFLEKPAILVSLFAPFHAAAGTATAILGSGLLVVGVLGSQPSFVHLREN
jgi:hypothetical protein